MKLTKYEVPDFPVLAWMAEASSGPMEISLRHGALVETGKDYFVEGAWNGPFATHDFHKADAFFGSGGRLADGELTIAPSASTTDYCYYQTLTDGRLLVTNSLPLLLAALDDELDPACRDYLRINNSILSGISSYQPRMPTKRGSVLRLVYQNLRLTCKGICLENKPFPAAFSCYRDYVAGLSASYAAIAENARDPMRRHPLQITSTQSKGYDSTAANAIAVEHGLDAVFSIARSKGHGKFADQDEAYGVDDSGEQIGQALGFDCTFVDRRALEGQPESEHLYYASLHASEDTNMAGINPHIKAPALLLSGCMGEITAPWDYYYARGYKTEHIADLERADHGGHGMGEIRLAMGFIHLPFFFIGARRREDILEITASPEMDPWRMHNNYDRPISRRIAEEAGVPRTHFGQQKNATAMVFTPPLLPVGAALRKEYIRYLDSAGVMPSWKWRLLPFVHSVNRVLWFVSPKKYLWLYYVQRVISRLIRRDYQFPTLWQQLDNAFYSFCVNKRACEYAMMMGQSPERISAVDMQEEDRIAPNRNK